MSKVSKIDQIHLIINLMIINLMNLLEFTLN